MGVSKLKSLLDALLPRPDGAHTRFSSAGANANEVNGARSR